MHTLGTYRVAVSSSRASDTSRLCSVLFITSQTLELEMSPQFSQHALNVAQQLSDPYNAATDAEAFNDLCNTFLCK